MAPPTIPADVTANGPTLPDGTAQREGISESNGPSASVVVDNEDGEADHSVVMLAADIELSRNRRTF